MSGNPPQLEGTSALISDRYLITVTQDTGESIQAGQACEISNNWTVKVSSLTSTASTKFCGIALTNPDANGVLTVICRGLARAVCQGTMNPGDLVGTYTGGLVQTLSSPTVGQVIGRCLQGGASGSTVVIMLF